MGVARRVAILRRVRVHQPLSTVCVSRRTRTTGVEGTHGVWEQNAGRGVCEVLLTVARHGGLLALCACVA